jgi:hypothetical protein
LYATKTFVQEEVRGYYFAKCYQQNVPANYQAKCSEREVPIRETWLQRKAREIHRYRGRDEARQFSGNWQKGGSCHGVLFNSGLSGSGF